MSTGTVQLSDGTCEISIDKFSIYEENFYKNSTPSKKIFNKFVVFADHYSELDSKLKKVYDDLGLLRGAKLRAPQMLVRTWYETLVHDITTAQEIMEFINLAEICGNETIFTLACFVFADDLSKLSAPEKIREKYGFENDLTDADKAQLEKEDKIWQTIKD